jgi:hypothetical protein
MTEVVYSFGKDKEEMYCPICKMLNHISDYVWCPYYEKGVYICSYCCLGNKACKSICKKTVEPQNKPLPKHPDHAVIDKILEGR